VVVPEVEPERSIALGFRVTVVAIFFLYGVPFAIILVAEVITPVEDIEAIVVAPYLNSNLPPDSSIVKLVVSNLGVEAAVPVVFWLKVGKDVRLAAEPLGARTSVPMTKPRFVRAVAVVVAPVPPLATATVPVTLDAVPVVFWLKVGNEVRDAADPVGANTSVPMTNPKLVLAPEAVDDPVPPSASAKSVMPVIEPPVIETLLDA
jgi:hypothetical protein